MKPLISVLIPVYNGAKYLNACLDSVLSQDFDSFEVVVIDDGSTDSTVSILDERAASDERMVVHHCPHLGISDARKAATAASSGEYLLSADSDDVMMPGSLKTIAAEIVSGHYDIVATDYIMTYEKSSRIREMHYSVPGAVLTGYDYLKDVYSYSMNPMLTLYTIRRSFWENLDYPPEFWCFEDTLLQAQMSLKCPVVKHIPFIAYAYLRRMTSISHHLPSAEYIAGWCGAMRKFLYTADGLSEDEKEFYSLLCDVRTYYMYVAHCRNPWKGNIEFARGIRDRMKGREAEISKFYPRFYIHALKLDAFRWLRPYVELLLTLRRWKMSVRKRLGLAAIP